MEPGLTYSGDCEIAYTLFVITHSAVGVPACLACIALTATKVLTGHHTCERDHGTKSPL